MPKTRHLSDLYKVGKMITLDDGDGEVKIWLQKMSPIDQETAVRRAGAKRAAVLALARDSEAPQVERGTYTSQLFDFAKDREDIIQFLANEQVSEHVSAYEAELAAEDEWAEDNYYQGLVDAWRDDFSKEFVVEDAEASEEAERVKSELERFQKVLENRIVREQEAAVKDFSEWSDKKLIDAATNKLIESRAGVEWLKEYRACEVWLGCRDPKNKKKHYFGSRDEINDLEFDTMSQLVEAYQNLNVEVTEGKDLEEVQGS